MFNNSKFSKKIFKSSNGTFDLIKINDSDKQLKEIILVLYINTLVQQFETILSENLIFKKYLENDGELSLQQFTEKFFKFYYIDIFPILLPPICVDRNRPKLNLEIKTSKKNAKYIYSILYLLSRLFYWFSSIIITGPATILITSKNENYHLNIITIIYKTICRKGYNDTKDQTIDLTIVEKLNKNLKKIIIFQKNYSNVWNNIIDFYYFVIKNNFPVEVYNLISLFLN